MSATTAFAKEISLNQADILSINTDEEIYNAINGITDLEIGDTFSAKAILEKSDGSFEDVDVYTTTKIINNPTSYGILNNDEPIYATTAVTTLASADKESVNHGNKQYVVALVTIFWTDVLGTSNEFRGASGSWTISTDPNTGKKATLSERYASLKGRAANATGEGKLYQIYPTSNSFEIKDSEYADGWFAYTLTSKVTINSDDKLSVSVTTGQINIG